MNQTKTPARYEVFDAMRRYGGSFVQALARAWSCADADNEARLLGAFPEIWDKYSELASPQEQEPDK